MFSSSLFLLLLFHLTHCSSMQPCHYDESSALLQFKESFIINKSASIYSCIYPKTESWHLEGRNSCCSWAGIECDHDSGHVIGLDLSTSCLYGSINSSSSLFGLVHLRMLNLADNHFNYSLISSRIGNLSSLIYLNLSNSFFSGQIPFRVSQLSQLSSLDLSYNSYSPFKQLLELKKPNFNSLVQNLTNLVQLDLAMVIISSPLPNVLANMSSLTSLRLPCCGLLGNFPTGMFQLPNLQLLESSYNPDLIGYLPNFYWSSPLKYFGVFNTGFFGEIPTSIGNLESLEYLNLRDCNFSGLIPPSLGNLSKLTTLDLSDNSLIRGQLPSSFANLTQLTRLALSFINLSSETFSWLNKNSKITHLNLRSNNLRGEIPPSLANWTQLSALELSSNQLTGSIPLWLMNLTKLTQLSLASNNLQGPIPSSISEPMNLQYLDLYSNNLSGTVDLNTLFMLKNLTYLRLSFNKLSVLTKTNSSASPPKFISLWLASCNLGQFPKFLQGQDTLMYLDLAFNNIHGQIPQWFWKISTQTLLYLDVAHNFLTGFDQPPSVLPWSSLLGLNMSSNRLSGSLPVPPFSTLLYTISENSLSGEIPSLICNLSLLQVLDLSGNNLGGMIPRCLSNFSSSLSILKLGRNNFHGTIPQTWTSASKLRMIDLGQNKLHGQVPRLMARCALLESLDLGNNQIVDTFPSWLGALPELKILILRSNRFYGAIRTPKFNFGFPKLRIIDMSFNGFTGSLPSEFFLRLNAMKIVETERLLYMEAHMSYYLMGFEYMDNFEYSMTMTNKGLRTLYTKIIEFFIAIDLSCNRFEGEIPDSIGTLKALHTLNLSNNILTGHIPSSIGNLTSLESLDLSQNKLSGEIPQQLVQLTFLAFLNVSYNNLTGFIPQGNQFDTFPSSSFEGNPGLWGSQLSRKCEGPTASLPLSTPSDDDQNSESSIEFGWKIVVIGYGCGTLIGVVIGHIVVTKKYDWFVMNFGGRHQRG
ncbi:hypothetical protein ACJW31_12G146500 [Castanea mollissima]